MLTLKGNKIQAQINLLKDCKNIIYIYIYIYIYNRDVFNCHNRENNNERILRLLPDRSKEHRKRQYQTSILVTFLIWFVEFICGIVFVVLIRVYGLKGIALVDASLHFILVPRYVLLNNLANPKKRSIFILC